MEENEFHTIEEKIKDDRQTRMLSLMDSMEQAWQRFKSSASRVTGRGSDELLITKVDEYPGRAELLSALDYVAKEANGSSQSWSNTLRTGPLTSEKSPIVTKRRPPFIGAIHVGSEKQYSDECVVTGELSRRYDVLVSPTQSPKSGSNGRRSDMKPEYLSDVHHRVQCIPLTDLAPRLAASGLENAQFLSVNGIGASSQVEEGIISEHGDDESNSLGMLAGQGAWNRVSSVFRSGLSASSKGAPSTVGETKLQGPQMTVVPLSRSVFVIQRGDPRSQSRGGHSREGPVASQSRSSSSRSSRNKFLTLCNSGSTFLEWYLEPVDRKDQPVEPRRTAGTLLPGKSEDISFALSGTNSSGPGMYTGNYVLHTIPATPSQSISITILNMAEWNSNMCDSDGSTSHSPNRDIVSHPSLSALVSKAKAMDVIREVWAKFTEAQAAMPVLTPERRYWLRMHGRRVDIMAGVVSSLETEAIVRPIVELLVNEALGLDGSTSANSHSSDISRGTTPS